MVASSAPRTIYDKCYDAHLAHEHDDGTAILYIDRHVSCAPLATLRRRPAC
jgi:3-isopropylmalate/(R)-2-methylmalate dehydratase large subunit